MKVRLMLLCTLLVLAAVPSFALPQCKECDANNQCALQPGAIEACYTFNGACWTEPDRCSPSFQATVLTDWTVTSIEISRPSVDSITVTAPSPAAEVAEPEPAAQK